jgi:hypothetical protein
LHLVSPPVIAGEHPTSTKPVASPDNNTLTERFIVVPSDLVMRGTHHRAGFRTQRRYL